MLNVVLNAISAMGLWLNEREKQFDPDTVTPGVGGFLVMALLMVAVGLLGYDLIRRLRRSQYRAEIQEKLQAELAEQNEQSERNEQTEQNGQSE